MLGSWNINVNVSGMPQKVATAIGELSEKLTGAEYTPIAYLGSQEVNGINHAVLAEQVLITGRDTKNIVNIIFNEKDGTVAITDIKAILKQGLPLGGLKIDAQTDIPEEAKETFLKTFEGYVGFGFKPFALLGSQVVNGTNYYLACEATSMTRDMTKTVFVIKVNTNITKPEFIEVFDEDKEGATSLSYAFTWLKNGNNLADAPLGEWP